MPTDDKLAEVAKALEAASKKIDDDTKNNLKQLAAVLKDAVARAAAEKDPAKKEAMNKLAKELMAKFQAVKTQLEAASQKIDNDTRSKLKEIAAVLKVAIAEAATEEDPGKKAQLEKKVQELTAQFQAARAQLEGAAQKIDAGGRNSQKEIASALKAALAKASAEKDPGKKTDLDNVVKELTGKIRALTTNFEGGAGDAAAALKVLHALSR